MGRIAGIWARGGGLELGQMGRNLAQVGVEQGSCGGAARGRRGGLGQGRGADAGLAGGGGGRKADAERRKRSSGRSPMPWAAAETRKRRVWDRREGAPGEGLRRRTELPGAGGAGFSRIGPGFWGNAPLDEPFFRSRERYFWIRVIVNHSRGMTAQTFFQNHGLILPTNHKEYEKLATMFSDVVRDQRACASDLDWVCEVCAKALKECFPGANREFRRLETAFHSAAAKILEEVCWLRASSALSRNLIMTRRRRARALGPRIEAMIRWMLLFRAWTSRLTVGNSRA